MRPQRLELAGFSAFRDATVVDFTDVELAAFVGPTGSGKSSLIDAMTFALYGSAARYDEKAVAPVIHQMASEARVQLEFEVGAETYTATRIVRRTRTGATTKEARLERGSEVLAGDGKAVTERVNALLGLDFERFNKTVVLPQGRFAEFLHDTPGARQQLLRELLGLGVYERVGQAARERARERQSTADVLEQAVAGIGDVSDERLVLLQANVVALGEAREGAATLTARMAKAQARQAELAQTLSRVDQALALLNRVRAPSDLAALTTATAEAAEVRQRAAQERQRARDAARAAASAAESGPQVADCQLLLAEHAQARELSEQLVADESAWREAEQAHQAAGTAAGAVRAELEELRAAQHAATKASEDAHERLRAAGDRGELTTLAERHQRSRLLAAEMDTLRTAEAEAAAAAARAREARDGAVDALEAIEQRIPAAALAQHLILGEQCPVCLQPVHALPVHADVGHDELAAAQRVRQAAIAEHERAAGSLASATADVRRAEQDASELAAQLSRQPSFEAAQAQLQELDALAEAVEATRRHARDAERAARDREGAEDVRAALGAEAAAEKALAAAGAAAGKAGSMLEAVTARLAGRPSELETTEALTQAQALDRTRRAAAEVAEHADGALAEADAAVQAIAQRERSARAGFAAIRDSLAVLQPPPATDKLVEDWARLMEWSAQQAAEARVGRARTVGEQQEAAEERESAAELLRRTASPFIDDVTDLDAVRDRLAEAEAVAKGEVTALQRDRGRVASARADIDAARAEGEVAKLLGELLRADRFERWLLQEALTDLVGRATVRLHQLTAGQYSLVTEAGMFRIVDHRNADEVRDARSLSGGETFLTSLALALALAESSVDLAAESAARLDSIFLDEGFGTLDADALDVVASTIEELGATGRMVGIVTHIRELAERMPVRFEVTKGASTSSVERVEA